jgi:hypothetical protein
METEILSLRGSKLYGDFFGAAKFLIKKNPKRYELRFGVRGEVMFIEHIYDRNQPLIKVLETIQITNYEVNKL